MEPLNIFEYERLAKERMSQASWDFDGGRNDDEVTLAASQAALARIHLRSRPLADDMPCDTTTSVLKTVVQMPLLVAPTHLYGRAHPGGEPAVAQASEAAGTLMLASTHAACTLEETAQAVKKAIWFHLSIFHDYLDVVLDLARRAYYAGYRAIVVDVPSPGNREQSKHDMPSLLPLPLVEANLVGYTREGLRPNGVNWDILDRLYHDIGLPVLVRGIVTVEDALLACDHAAGIIVSNHDGHQLDRAVTSIEALPEIVDAVAGREVYLEGGVYCGTDILKALALGARAVLVDSPILWGLAADGAHGVQRVLEILHTELELAMKQAGCPTLASINRTLVKWS
ncbi:MAG TPA: alpha-hydroxy-acid oxidizing protein [Ktedonobacteraceae bacterium]|nr:alpha-hydroxy-acid oxidizing protein [Ktedonobacteraceae bacterium]